MFLYWVFHARSETSRVIPANRPRALLIIHFFTFKTHSVLSQYASGRCPSALWGAMQLLYCIWLNPRNVHFTIHLTAFVLCHIINKHQWPSAIGNNTYPYITLPPKGDVVLVVQIIKRSKPFLYFSLPNIPVQVQPLDVVKRFLQSSAKMYRTVDAAPHNAPPIWQFSLCLCGQEISCLSSFAAYLWVQQLPNGNATLWNNYRPF